MTRLTLFFVGLFITSCFENKTIDTPGNDTINSKMAPILTSAQTIGTLWIESFREFRNAVFQSNKYKAKEYFNFPVLNVNNEIWYLTTDYDLRGDIFITDSLKPFTDKDFDKFFYKIFPTNFVKAFLKVKTDELYKKGETETVELTDGKATTFKIIASIDKENKTLELNFASNTIRKSTNGEILDGGEFNIMYQFNILEIKFIKFKQIRLAG